MLHFDPEVWGSNAAEFDAERFLGNKLSQHPSFKPFGGGNSLCPGRTLARRSIFNFVALLAVRFDIALEPTAHGGKQAFPRVNDEKPGLGSFGPLDTDDVVLSLHPS